MSDVFHPNSNPRAFLERAVEDGYSMQEGLIRPEICDGIVDELSNRGYDEDFIELVPTSNFERLEMMNTHLLHSALNGVVNGIADDALNLLSKFSVRIFEPGVHSTTIHRNHRTIGPWAIGITLVGSAPFNVYSQDQLPDDDTVRELLGDSTDPIPTNSMFTTKGDAWALYTANERVPHGGGIVTSEHQRKLLVMYNSDF